MFRGHSRRASNSSAATFDLASGNRSPLPEAESDHPLSVDEELATLRADKEHLTTVVADMQYVSYSLKSTLSLAHRCVITNCVSFCVFL